MAWEPSAAMGMESVISARAMHRILETLPILGTLPILEIPQILETQ